MAEAIAPEILNESKRLSVEFFTDPRSYDAFSLTRDKRLIVGCIEPRDPDNCEHGDYKVTIQTPGGDIGEGSDHALTHTAVTGEAIRIKDALPKNADMQLFKSLDAHLDCAFHANLAVVTSEMATPSDFTRDSLFEWAEYFNKQEVVAENLGRITTAAEAQLEVVTEFCDDDLLAITDSLQPGHPNVYGVKGRPMARTYVMNFHPHVGKNRNMKPTDPDRAVLVQGYHDNIAAMVSDLETVYSLNGEMRGLRLVSLLLRSAATRTVITRDKMSEMAFLDVIPAAKPGGLEFKQREF